MPLRSARRYSKATAFFARQILEQVGRRAEPGRLFMFHSGDESVALDSAVQVFVAALKARPNPRTAFEYERVTGLSHDNTPQFGQIDGLRFVFHDMSLAGN